MLEQIGVNKMKKLLSIITILTILIPHAVFADTVAQSQRMLNQLGYNAGPVDGAYGGKTKRALEAFYAKSGGSYDGKLDTNEVIDLRNAVKEIKTNNGKHKKILPKRYSTYPDWCTYENKYTYERIENLLGNKNHDLKTIELFGKSDEQMTVMIEQLTLHVNEFILHPNQQNANDIKKIYFLLFENKFFIDLHENSHNNSLMMKDFLILSMYSFQALDRDNYFDTSEKQIFLSEIQKRFDKIKPAKKWGFTMSGCKIGRDQGGCQNHTYSHQLTRTLYGATFGSIDDYAMGEKMYKFAIDDLNPDGALWREAVRGRWSWNYYAHALGLLLSIADIYKHNGVDLYSYKSDKNGLTIHDAVSFLLESIQDNEKIWLYAKELKGVQHYINFTDYKSPENLQKLITNTEKSGLKNWFYIYRNNFPIHPNTQLGNKLIPTYKSKLETSKHMGILAQCLYAEKGQKLASLEGYEKFDNIIEKFDRDVKSMQKKLSCLQSAFNKKDMGELLSKSDMLLMSKAFKNDQKPKNKSNLIRAGLNPILVNKNKKYLLRLINFTGNVETFCSKPIK